MIRLICSANGGLAQLARAPALHAGGRGFESHVLHQLIINDFLEVVFILYFEVT